MAVIKKYRKVLIIIGVAILVSIFFCYPYLNNKMVLGHDIKFHLARIQQIARELSSGNFPVLIHSDLVDGLGYGNSLFYPEIFLYIPAVIYNMGISLVTSFKIFIIFITFITFMSMFIVTRRITKSDIISVISSILYTFSLYRIVDVYTRAAIGEVLVFIFLPIVVLGCYELFVGDKSKWWILPFGIFGVVNSHIISFAFAVGIIFFFMIINVKGIIKEKRIRNIIIAGVISILVTLSVLLPILEQKSSNDYNVFVGGTSKELSERSMQLTLLFIDDYRYGYDMVNDLINGRMNLGIGIMLLVLPLFIFVTKWKDKKQKKILIQIFILGVLALLATTKLFPWKLFRFLNIIQVPWRLNIISTMCFSIVGAYCIYNVMDQKRDSMIILSIIIVYVTSSYLGKVIYSDVTNTEMEYTSIGVGEYLPSIPIDTEEKNVFNIEDKNVTYEFEKNRNKITFETTQDKNGKQINIPLIYYKGYEAQIQTSDNKKQELELSRNDENGQTKLINENELIGKITIEYKMTLIQKCSYLLTYLTVIFLIIYIMLKFVKRKFAVIEKK